MIIKGFCNGKEEYIIRFTPDETEPWEARPVHNSWIKNKLPSCEFFVTEKNPVSRVVLYYPIKIRRSPP